MEIRDLPVCPRCRRPLPRLPGDVRVCCPGCNRWVTPRDPKPQEGGGGMGVKNSNALASGTGEVKRTHTMAKSYADLGDEDG